MPQSSVDVYPSKDMTSITHKVAMVRAVHGSRGWGTAVAMGDTGAGRLVGRTAWNYKISNKSAKLRL